MEKLFVPYELAVKLKEKGFDEKCIGYIMPTGKTWLFELMPLDKNCLELNPKYAGGILSPLYQQVVDWFREKQGIVIELTAYEVGWMTTLSKYPKIEKYIFQKVEIESYYDALNKGIEESLKLI